MKKILTITKNSDKIILSDEGKTNLIISRRSRGKTGRTEKGKSMEEMSVFKSYLRRLLQDLKDLKEALKNKNYEKAEEMADKLIEDTQKGIEDS